MSPREPQDAQDDVSLEDERSGDDRDEGWGGSPQERSELDDDWYLSQRPPHWD